MFEALDKYLDDGYKITDSVHLSVEVTKNNLSYLLGYIDVKISANIKDNLKALDKNFKLSYPNYSNCMLNIISAIRKNYGYNHPYEACDYLFDKHYKNVIILLLDGLGLDVLEHNLNENSFLRKNVVHINSAIYPSTTAASTTATKCGLSPLSSGWTGWENYLKEANRNLVLFTGYNYVTDEPTGISLYNYIPYNMFYYDMDVEGSVIEPDFSNHNHKLQNQLKRSLSQLKKANKPVVQYIYYTDPDKIMHQTGTNSKETKTVIEALNLQMESFAKKLPNDTLLIISADHGHINCNPINIYTCNPILKLLNRRPSNDARCITFSVKNGKEKEFEHLFNSLFGYAYKLYKTKDAINEGFFGKPNDPINQRVNDFLADYVAVGIKDYYFNYKDENAFIFKSHHAGITRDEMLVPVIAIRR
jgi:hypothetical protein